MWGQLGSCFMDKYQIWLRKSTLIDLTERNINKIIPLYCHLPVSWRSLVDWCVSLGSFKPQILFYFVLILWHSLMLPKPTNQLLISHAHVKRHHVSYVSTPYTSSNQIYFLTCTQCGVSYMEEIRNFVSPWTNNHWNQNKIMILYPFCCNPLKISHIPILYLMKGGR